ncbi:MAG TPA: ABC transporter ATP-binding protein [Chloroflexota bacterium]
MGESATSTPAVRLQTVAKEFATNRQGERSVAAVDHISFDAHEGELLVLLGPSGCGKTTTLRMIAGLEEPDAGEIWIGNRLVSSDQRNVFVPTEKRHIGMVFQSYAIWPHMTVFDNVAYPLKVRRTAKHVIREKVEHTLELVGLHGLESRSATQLSGGQQQRVALARAIVFEPRLLLLDEPLSNLDAKLRVHMRTELKHLQQQTGITSVFVTHDQAESMALADRIIVMNQGRIEQVGTPHEIYERPRSRFVSEFVGSINVLSAVVESLAGNQVTLNQAGREVRCVTDRPLAQGDQVLISVRPEKLSFVRANGGANTWEGQVASVAYYGDHREYEVEVDELRLKVTTAVNVAVERGDRVFLACDPAEMVVMMESAG